jgi:SAM-dependent methyltransferase
MSTGSQPGRGRDPGFARHDERDDARFYATPRETAYLDDAETAALARVLVDVLPPGGRYLDLMSGRWSHLPAAVRPGQVLGLGLNAQELATNERLDRFVVHDLNRDPSLPLPCDHFHAAVCTASVQYLTQPVAVFREVRRVLKPAGVFVVSFSGNCFPRKAVARWLVLNDEQRDALVRSYFQDSAGWSPVRGRVRSSTSRPDAVRGSFRILWATTVKRPVSPPEVGRPPSL